MKILKLELKGTDEVLGNVVNLIMKNPNVEVMSLKKEEENIYREPIRVIGGKKQQPYQRFSNHPHAVWLEEGSSRQRLDPIATMKKMNITKEWLMGRSFGRDTFEYTLKASLTKTHQV